MRCAAGVVEDAGDKKAGEDKEDVDTCPTPAQLSGVVNVVLDKDK